MWTSQSRAPSRTELPASPERQSPGSAIAEPGLCANWKCYATFVTSAACAPFASLNHFTVSLMRAMELAPYSSKKMARPGRRLANRKFSQPRNCVPTARWPVPCPPGGRFTQRRRCTWRTDRSSCSGGSLGNAVGAACRADRVQSSRSRRGTTAACRSGRSLSSSGPEPGYMRQGVAYASITPMETTRVLSQFAAPFTVEPHEVNRFRSGF